LLHPSLEALASLTFGCRGGLKCDCWVTLNLPVQNRGLLFTYEGMTVSWPAPHEPVDDPLVYPCHVDLAGIVLTEGA
jgi:hypothetical protein